MYIVLFGPRMGQGMEGTHCNDGPSVRKYDATYANSAELNQMHLYVFMMKVTYYFMWLTSA